MSRIQFVRSNWTEITEHLRSDTQELAQFLRFLSGMYKMSFPDAALIYITKKVQKNNGECPMYLVSDHHEAIIDRDMFNRVQQELARRVSKRKTSDKTIRTCPHR